MKRLSIDAMRALAAVALLGAFCTSQAQDEKPLIFQTANEVVEQLSATPDETPQPSEEVTAEAAVEAVEPTDAAEAPGVSEAVEEALEELEEAGSTYTFPSWLLPRVFYGYVEYPEDKLFSETDCSTSWVKEALRTRARNDRMVYNLMIADPSTIQYAFWQLPVPPNIQTDDSSFSRSVGKGNKAEPMDIEVGDAQLNVKKKHWLHDAGASLQFSQAYISPNWYQGGTGSLTLLGQARWNVKLNQAWHPKLIFDNTVSYKLGLTSQPFTPGRLHEYLITEDLFQWNMIAGHKAFSKFFYTLTTQFKTQFLNSYPADSNVRKASFLSPAELNVGAGLTFQTTNKKETMTFSCTVSPLSYNMKACIDKNVDETQFGIAAGHKTISEIGSGLEANLQWQICSNISWRSRLFFFTNYKNVQADWENNLVFTINKYLSTQILIHPRYDTTTDAAISNSGHSWRYWMLKEVLSFGISYNFVSK